MYKIRVRGDNRGFSLIELFVVAVIVAIIAAIAIPMYKGSLPDAYAPEAEAVLSAISTAAQRYRLENSNSFVGMDANNMQKLKDLGLDLGTTNKWSFTLSNVQANSFTVVASGNGTAVSDLAGKTITMQYNIGSTPHEQRSCNF
jgi:prepilin-type N-terminal cleavage/methylation domain-containing protein